MCKYSTKALPITIWVLVYICTCFENERLLFDEHYIVHNFVGKDDPGIQQVANYDDIKIETKIENHLFETQDKLLLFQVRYMKKK